MGRHSIRVPYARIQWSVRPEHSAAPRHMKGTTMGFTWNKALVGGVGSALLSLLAFIGPVASHVPVLGLVVGLGTAILTWVIPNADAKPSSS